MSGPESLQFWGSNQCVQIITHPYWLKTYALSEKRLTNKTLVAFAWIWVSRRFVHDVHDSFRFGACPVLKPQRSECQHHSWLTLLGCFFLAVGVIDDDALRLATQATIVDPPPQACHSISISGCSRNSCCHAWPLPKSLSEVPLSKASCVPVGSTNSSRQITKPISAWEVEGS